MKILLGISASIAAYKAPFLVRRLIDQGAEVRVVMTQGATALIGPLTLQAVSGFPVRTELFDPAHEAAMGHIELAKWPDSLLIAPASADILAKLSLGLADDLLSTLALASTARLIIAPAMNQAMWAHPATQQHVATLKRRGALFIGPATGSQACGDEGFGRMAEPEEIVASLFTTGTQFKNKTFLITAGPTFEPIDPVRFIGNRSSGKMGFALVEEARKRGAKVILIHGPTKVPPPITERTISVKTAEEMYNAVMAEVKEADIFISTAAVSDYRVEVISKEKIKKTADAFTLHLVKNKDILATVSALSKRPFCVGFAAESQNIKEGALEKLYQKKLDLIVTNNISDPSIGFDSNENSCHVFWKNGETTLDRASKINIAQAILNIVGTHYEKYSN